MRVLMKYLDNYIPAIGFGASETSFFASDEQCLIGVTLVALFEP
jgi:hypothetical protein